MKLEPYPKDSPEAFAVGFNVQTAGGRVFYMDTLVPVDKIESGMNDEAIVKMAYTILEKDIKAKSEELAKSKPKIVGIDFEIKDVSENPVIEGESTAPIAEEDNVNGGG